MLEAFVTVWDVGFGPAALGLSQRKLSRTGLFMFLAAPPPGAPFVSLSAEKCLSICSDLNPFHLSLRAAHLQAI